MKNLLLILALFTLTSRLWAQGTFTAASASYADVNACVNSGAAATCSPGGTHTAINGDTIIIPAGSAPWTSNLVGPAGVGFTLKGSGTPQSGSGVFGASSSCATTTVITDNAGNSTYLMSFSPAFGTTIHISCLDIEPPGGVVATFAPIGIGGTCTVSGCPQVRIDNVTFGNTTQWTSGNNGTNSTEVIHIDNAFGVMDHNTAPNGNNTAMFVSAFTAYLGVGASGDNSWAQPDTFGAAGNVFAENNVWNTSTWAMEDCEAPGPNGCRFVVRFNQFTGHGASQFGICGNHGTETGGRLRSGREFECHDNTFTVASTSTAPNVYGVRGGTAMFYHNSIVINSGGFLSGWGAYNVFRNVANSPPWGYCGGLNAKDAYDQNDNTVSFSGTTSTAGLTLTDGSQSFPSLIPSGAPYTVYNVTQNFMSEVSSNTATTITIQGPISESGWTGFNIGDSYQVIRATVCLDQPGRGQGTLLTGFASPTPTGWVSEALDPIYDWGNSTTNTLTFGSGGNKTLRLIAFRDFYVQSYPQVAQTTSSSPFSCNGSTGGVGWGIGSNRPTSCSGACATNNPGCGYWSTDTSGGLVANTLYTWNSGAWAVHHSQFTYPHPLISGGGGPPGAPCPTCLTAVPLPAQPPMPVLTLSIPASSYVTASGFSQDGKVWNKSLTLTLTGTGFTSATICTFSGTAIPCSCGSATTCTAIVPSSLVPVPSVATKYAVTVTNPASPIPIVQ
jgi:hypothetical protein